MIKTLLAVVALLFVAQAMCEDSNVLVFTSKNFDEEIKKHEIIMVEFYAPWCGHCKSLAPQYEEAANILKSEGISLAKVDCDAEHELCSQNQVQGFPTLKVFRDGEFTLPYQGERSAAAIASFMKKQKLPAASELKGSVKAFVKETLDNHEIPVVAVLEDLEGEDFNVLMKKATVLANKGFTIVYTTDKSVSEKYTKHIPTILAFTDDQPSVYQPPLWGPEFKDADLNLFFLKENAVPIYDGLGGHNFEKYSSSGLPLAILFIKPSDRKPFVKYEKIMKTIARKFRGKINFVYADADRFGQHSKMYGLSGETFPCFAIDTLATNTHFAYPETKPLVEDEMIAWVESFASGELKPTVKSDPIPETNDGPVKVIVGQTFNEIALDPTKSVLVEFYAPWCGHCKNLAPIYEKLGELLKEHKDIVIAKMDATTNDPPSTIQIQGFPTIMFFPALDKTPVDYNGGRDLASFVTFLQGHVSADLSSVLAKAQEASANETHEHGHGHAHAEPEAQEGDGESPVDKDEL